MKVKNLKVAWPTILAVVLGVSLVSCHNEKMKEEAEKQMWQNNLVTFEETFVKADRTVKDYELEEIVIPEGLILEEENIEEEAGFSK